MRRRIPAPLSAPQPPQGILPMPSPFFAHNKKRGHQWPRNSRNLLYFPCSWDNIESRPHLSRHARVGRTLLSDAFDLDLDFAGARPELCNPEEERRFSAASSPNECTAASAAEVPSPALSFRAKHADSPYESTCAVEGSLRSYSHPAASGSSSGIVGERIDKF